MFIPSTLRSCIIYDGALNSQAPGCLSCKQIRILQPSCRLFKQTKGKGGKLKSKWKTCVAAHVRVCVEGSQRDNVEVTQREAKIHTLKAFKHTHILTHGHRHTHINQSARKPPVLSSAAVSRVVSKAACGAGLWCCREDQVQMGLVCQTDLLTSAIISDFVTLLYILLQPLD